MLLLHSQLNYCSQEEMCLCINVGSWSSTCSVHVNIVYIAYVRNANTKKQTHQCFFDNSQSIIMARKSACKYVKDCVVIKWRPSWMPKNDMCPSAFRFRWVLFKAAQESPLHTALALLPRTERHPKMQFLVVIALVASLAHAAPTEVGFSTCLQNVPWNKHAIPYCL